ncbi:helix-turn-helix domain-containing protein [Salinarchaeum laminariae]|uniref:helix-turn-helix domain-containing protein n=1 Tax=Salinarchaeum laminariae TaxID=869888 RepID=UPI0020BE39A3|nr:helix-turn-helix domain-containing protein [Salinarchaeum laminariae]
MGYLAEYTVHCDSLPLVDVSARVPEATLTVQVGQPNQGGPPPFAVTIRGPDLDEAEAALDASPFVAETVRLAADADARRYRIVPAPTMEEQLGPAISDVERLRGLAATQAVLEHVEVVRDGWRQRRRCADRAAFENYWSFWREEHSVTIHRLVESPECETGTPATDALSDRQREALLTAFELGYFEVPRGATLADVAAKLGISAASASERLRRAQRTLIAGSLDAPGAGAQADLIKRHTV